MKYDQCQKRKKTKDTKKRNKSAQESKGLAVIPYVEGLSETAERIFRKYGINTAVKPYRTLRQLVHPKDQCTVEQTGECVYRILCHNCDCTYIGETGRNYGKRQEEHRKEVEENVHTVRPEEQGSRNEQVGHNRSCSERKSYHKLCS